MGKRVFLLVLDSFGIGEAKDAALYQDNGSNTFYSVFNTGNLNIPNLKKLGLFNIDGIAFGTKEQSPIGAFGRLCERSAGKDTTVGHFEIAGHIMRRPLPTYPQGFPEEVIFEFEQKTGRKTLCNRPYSGTQVIKDYGEEHLRTGALIVYTSADSVFQIAAHEDIVSNEQLYDYCRTARKILHGRHAVGRVIARPFQGRYPFVRTAGRRDFSLEPDGDTMLDLLSRAGFATKGIGKIHDIFAGRGLSDSVKTISNADGMDRTIAAIDEDFTGLCFVNLVDFDMKFGHRNDISGYTEALNAFDSRLGTLMDKMHPNDILILTADHGCDPATESTDHSREDVPVLIYGKTISPGINLGTREGFCDISASVLDIFGIRNRIDGASFLPLIFRDIDLMIPALIRNARDTRKLSYSPYSDFQVGASLLTKSGKIYNGCNCESVSYSPTVCAERAAFSSAISHGERSFTAICITGGKKDDDSYEICYPCGVCRQFISEFCGEDFLYILTDAKGNYTVYKSTEIFPYAFAADISAQKPELQDIKA